MPSYNASKTSSTRTVITILTIWLLAVVVCAETGVFASILQPFIAAIVAVTIVAPTLWYFSSHRFRSYMEVVGHRKILLFHTWRIPAALLFFWYGTKGDLPPLFWILAGAGDFMAGLLAGYVLTKPDSARRYMAFHLFGFADFVVAVGTGLTYTLLADPRMSAVTVLPLALIPLFGVGISGATHLMAFDMLRRGAGFQPKREPTSGSSGGFLV